MKFSENFEEILEKFRCKRNMNIQHLEKVWEIFWKILQNGEGKGKIWKFLRNSLKKFFWKISPEISYKFEENVGNDWSIFWNFWEFLEKENRRRNCGKLKKKTMYYKSENFLANFKDILKNCKEGQHQGNFVKTLRLSLEIFNIFW